MVWPEQTAPKELRTEIEAGLEKYPDWYGGEAMLALIEFKDNKREEAKQRLEKLLADESRIKAMPAYAGWIVGQELEGFEDLQDVTLKLFEHAAKSDREQSLSYSPVVKLINTYDKLGRKDDARDLMIKLTKRTNNEGYNDDYYTSIEIGNKVWVGKKLLEMGYPVDSVKLFRGVLDTPKEKLEQAQRYGYADNAAGQAKKGFEDALVALNADNAGDAMQELLAAREDAKKGEALLDLMLRVPTVQTLQKESMDSQLVTLLKSISSNEALANGVVDRLEELQKDHPTDVSLALAKAMFALEKERESLEEDLQSLLTVVTDNPLDEVAEGRRPNARQRRQARQHVPLWLVARKLLENEEQREIGQQLAEFAIAGARRQLDQNDAVSILYDWGKRSIDAGDRDSAEAKWSELLDLVTKRPERKKKPGANAPMIRGRRVAPPARAGAAINFKLPSRTTSPSLREGREFNERGGSITIGHGVPTGLEHNVQHASPSPGLKARLSRRESEDNPLSLSEYTPRTTSPSLREGREFNERGGSIAIGHGVPTGLEHNVPHASPSPGLKARLSRRESEDNLLSLSEYTPRRKPATSLLSLLTGQLNVQTALFGQVAAPATFAVPVQRSAPAPRIPAGRPAGGKHIPPLTLSQFRTTIEIALVAAKNDMPKLSQRAIKKSLEGGIPVPDANPGGAGNSPFGGMRVTRTSSNQSNANPIETEVANSLRKVLTFWDAKTEYPADVVYELLTPIVLPENRPAEIMMYADSSKLNDAQTKSLGLALVRWAKKADQLDDFLAKIEARKDKPAAKVPAMVLQSQIAIAKEDFDAANERLAALNDSIRQQPLQPMIQLACHTAIPATDHEQLEANAYKILKFAVKQQYSQPNRNSNVTLGKLVSKVNSYLAKSGDSKAISEFFDSYLVSRQEHYSRYSGDYGNYRQQMDIANMAEEAAKTGATDTALDFMGRVTDVELTNYGKPSVKTALAVTTKKLLQKPAKERYEAWRDWTMPTKGRETIRFVAEFAPPVATPDAFLNEEAKAWKSAKKYFMCNLTEMVLAAKEAGSLAEVIELAGKAKEEKLDYANILLPIALIHDGKVDAAKPLVEELIASIVERNKSQEGRRRDILPDYALFRTCMEYSTESAQLYRQGRHAFYKSRKVNCSSTRGREPSSGLCQT